MGSQDDNDGLGQEVLDVLDRHFVDRDLLESWKTKGRAKDLLLACKSRRDTNADELLKQIGLSHTRRLTPHEIDYYHLLHTYASAALSAKLRSLFPNGVVRYPGIELTTLKKGSQTFVLSLAQGGLAQRAGLLPGDELISVNGLPYQPVESFRPHVGKPVSVGYRREAGGPVVSASITPTISLVRELLIGASRRSASVISWRAQSIGYFRPWSLAGDRYWRLLVKILTRNFEGCDALVLDLRGGIGGASPEYAEFFVGRSPELTILGSHERRETINRHWRKPVVLITDETTRSGNEVLAFALQRAGVATVGARTAGEVTMGRPFLLSDGSLMIVAVASVTVDGVTLEGTGVEPDFPVPHDIAYAAGIDPPLDAALDEAVRCSSKRVPT